MKKSPSSNKSNSKSIYRNQDAALQALFELAGDPRKVLCVAFDYAKQNHVALCCDGNGNLLKGPFTVENSTAGVAFLIEQINASARARKIPKSQIFLGGEDEPSYVANFTAALRAHQYLVMRVNAFQAKENRENLVASTDKLDLLAIAKTLLSRCARSTPCIASAGSPNNDVYYQLREITRSRRSLVRSQTAASNRIHALVDQLFPGFLDPVKSGLTPFCDASMELMKERFSAPEITRRRLDSLASFLARHHVREHHKVALQIITLARNALPPSPERIAGLQSVLSTTVDLHVCLHKNAHQLRQQAALLLASTPYSMLTSIPGIGFTLAAGMASELGHPSRLNSLDCLCSFAGIVPRTSQTGGPNQPAFQGRTQARCNHILKDWTVQSAQKIHLLGPPELKDRITRWNANGQAGIFAGAKRYLRLLRTLVLNQVPYLDPRSRAACATDHDRALAAQTTWQGLLRKWHSIPGGIALITNEATPLGFWRRTAMESRHIHLSLKP